jgi:hypothetical protein
MGAQSAKRRFPARADYGSMWYSKCTEQAFRGGGGWFRWDEYGSMYWNKFSQLELLDYDEQPADRRGPRPTAAGDRPTVQRDFLSNHQRAGFPALSAQAGAAAPVTAPASAYCTRGDFGGEGFGSWPGPRGYLQYLREHLRIGMRVRATEGDRRGNLGTFHDGPVLPGWVSALSVSHSKSVLYGVFAWARRAQNVGFRPGQIAARPAGGFAGTSVQCPSTDSICSASAKWSSSTTTSSRRTAVARGPPPPEIKEGYGYKKPLIPVSVTPSPK